MDSRTPTQSKKLIAYLVAEASWKVLIALALIIGYAQISWTLFWIVLTLVLVAGLIEVAYLLGQAGLDKYTHLIDIVTTKAVKVVEAKGVRIENHATNDVRPATDRVRNDEPGV